MTIDHVILLLVIFFLQWPTGANHNARSENSTASQKPRTVIDKNTIAREKTQQRDGKHKCKCKKTQQH